MKKTLLIAATLAASTTATAQDAKHFDGFFLGAEAGIWTADDIDTNIYYGAVAGFRKQTDSNIVFGIEGTFGNNASEVTVGSITSSYDHEWTAQGIIGRAFGENNNNLLFVGGGVAGQRATAEGLGQEVADTGTGYVVTAGYERALGSNLSLRAVARTYEFNNLIGTLGISYRF